MTVPVPLSGFWAASVSEVPAHPPPCDTDEIPPTDPAPPTPTERVPSMTEEDFARHEAVTAIRCPHPPGLDGAPRVG